MVHYRPAETGAHHPAVPGIVPAVDFRLLAGAACRTHCSSSSAGSRLQPSFASDSARECDHRQAAPVAVTISFRAEILPALASSDHFALTRDPGVLWPLISVY